jgi:hypothetical protein
LVSAVSRDEERKKKKGAVAGEARKVGCSHGKKGPGIEH